MADWRREVNLRWPTGHRGRVKLFMVRVRQLWLGDVRSEAVRVGQGERAERGFPALHEPSPSLAATTAAGLARR